MRRSLMLIARTALAAGAALAGLGCEDGPTQTFAPAPNGAGNNWNSSTPPPAAANAGQGFNAGYPSTSKTLICSEDIKRQRWAWMLTQPVQPPRFYAGLDMAGDDLWDGLTIDAAEKAPVDPNMPGGGLCQSIPLGFQGVCPSGFGGCNGNQWGNNGEVNFFWNVATHLVDQMTLNLGYTGTMTTGMYPDHNGQMHSYSVGVGDVLRRDGQPFYLQWTDKVERAIQITDIFNATMATFAQKAGVPFDTSSCMDDSTCTAPGTKSICECQHVIDPQTMKPTSACMAAGQCGIKNCGSDGNCLVYDDGSTTIFGIRPMVIYTVGQAGVPQPQLSTPNQIYNFFSKWEPFSNLPQVVKLDGEGAVAKGTPVGVPAGATITCTQGIGQTFDDFVNNCVQVHGDKSNPNGVDAVNLNKVVHSLTHDQEHWTANVLGVNQNFTSLKVLSNPDLVVLDTDTPQSGDIAQDWTFDVRARGNVVNEFTPGADIYHPGSTPTLQGSALIFIEWARLMLADIARLTGNPVRPLGDPACIGYTGGVPNFKITNSAKNPNSQYASCSGMEGLIVPSGYGTYGTIQPDFTKDPQHPELDAGINYDIDGLYLSVLKPGDLYGAFCVDPGSMNDCTAQSFSVWQNALQHAIRVMGGGDLTRLPNEMQDRRYYFKWYGVAYVKYLLAYGNYAAKYGIKVQSFPDGTVGGGLGPSDVMNQKIDMESLFFDYLAQPGAGGEQTFDKFEYIDRAYIGQGVGGTPPANNEFTNFNQVPFDFEYGCDLFGGNQRYDDWFRRMDREEIALYASMLTDKTHTPGMENNVNVTNLFGSVVLGGDPVSGVSGPWPSWACAVGRAGDPAANCGGVNAPLDPTLPSNPVLDPANCPNGQEFAVGYSFENGIIGACGPSCDFTTYPLSGCKSPTQTCVPDGTAGACIDQMMDKNNDAVVNPGGNNAKPLLWNYPGVWSRTPFSRGHSPIHFAAADKHPNIGVAKVHIPNFVTDPANPATSGPYTYSPIAASAMGTCPMGYSPSTNGAWCNAATNTGTGTSAPEFAALTPWLESQPAVGFPIPLDAQHSQWVAGGQFDFTGVLESYIVDYRPYVDKAKPSCVTDGMCNKGFICCDNSKASQAYCTNGATHDCVTDDGTVQITGIEGQDFLGQAFLCQDPTTNDILHVGMYDNAQRILDWLAAHPGDNFSPYIGGPIASAQVACNIVVIRSPYDNYVDFIVSKANGVTLNIGTGQGQGRVTDIVLWDPSLVQSL